MPCSDNRIGCEVYENLSFSVIVIDKDFNVISRNNKAEEKLKESLNKSDCTKCYSLTHGRDKPCYYYDEMCPVKECFETKEFTRAVHRHIYEGNEVFEEINATPVFDNEGNILYVIEEVRDISKLLKLETVINSLRGEVKLLQGLLPICASCKKIKDDEGYWKEVENYIADRSDAKFSHSICPDCLKELYPEVAKKMEEKKSSGKNS
ncbi:MAG: PAS domain-containing protein [Candidatus Delongbacteria bacterium]|nr:PAS domain-containing protein [Candidatus Delongbacteria bacterium]